MSSTLAPRPILAVVLSLLAHVGVGQGLGAAPRSDARVEPPRSFEIEVTPEPEPVPQTPEPPRETLPPEPEPAPQPLAPKPAAPASPAEPAPEPPTSEPAVPAVPGFVTAPGASDGPGLPAGQPGAAGGVARASRPAPSAPPRPLPAPAPPRQVSYKDLSVKPRPPRLDDALRRNYPSSARLSGRAGEARVLLDVSSLGQVTAIRVVSATEPAFAEACRRTLLGTRWTAPLDRAGHPVRTLVPYECRFRVTP